MTTNATATKARISQADARLRVLGSQLGQLEEQRRAALLALPIGQDHSSREHATLQSIEEALERVRSETATLRELRVVLEDSLPSPEVVAAAGLEATALAERAEAGRAVFTAAWTDYQAALDAAEGAARRVVAARKEAAQPIAELDRVRDRYGLDVVVPKVPKPGHAESDLASRQTLLLREVALGQTIERMLEAELASARARVPATVPAAVAA